jgi:hypothetical protein
MTAGKWQWNREGSVFEKNLQKGRSVWDGVLDKRGKVSGFGIYSNHLGDKRDMLDWQYKGNCLDGFFSGKGFLVKFWDNGNNHIKQYEYHGNFLNDKFHGRGTLKLYNSAGLLLESYEGEWKHGKRHGRGKCDFEDGSHYDGNWQNHRIRGKGEWTYPLDSPTTFSFRYFSIRFKEAESKSEYVLF